MWRQIKNLYIFLLYCSYSVHILFKWTEYYIVKKIISSYQNSFVKPEIIVSSGAFKFILPNQNIIVLNDVSKDSIKDNKEKLILNILSDKSFHSRLEFEKALGVSTSTIRRILQKLIKEELVAIKGEGKNTLYYLK